MKHVYFITAVICLISFSAICHADTYYVGQYSAGNETGSSYSNRFSVKQHNSSKFYPGDKIVLIGNITSPIIFPSSGDNNFDITYTGKYNGLICNISTPNAFAVQTNGKDHITISEIEISSALEGIVNGRTDDISYNIKIKKCKIHNAKNRGILLSYIRNSVVGGSVDDGNEIFNCGGDTAGGDVAIGTGGENILVSHNHLYGNGIDQGVDGVVVEAYADGTIIEYNKIHDHWREDGIDLKKARHVTVRFNDIYGHKNQTGITVQMNSNNIKVYGNRIWNNNMGFWIRDGHTGTDPVENIHFFSNIVYNNVQAGVLINSAGEGAPDGPFYIYNNLISDNSTAPESQIYCGIGIAAGSKEISVMNNILYDARVFENQNIRQVYTKLEKITTLDYNSYAYGNGDSLIYYEASDKNLAQLRQYNQELNGTIINISGLDPVDQENLIQFDSIGFDLGPEYAAGIDPYNTDWSQTPPKVVTLDRKDGEWSKGPYVYNGTLKKVTGLKLVSN